MNRSLWPKRRFRSVLTMIGTAVAASLVLAGCSGTTTSSSSSSSSSSDSASTTSYPVSIKTALGTTTIDAKPKRVVALGWGDAETALELGVQPVGASDWLGFGGDGVGPWLKGAYTKSPKIIGTLEPSYEDIVKLKPDLILDVRSSGDATRYQKLSAIAPTLAVPNGGKNYLTSTKQQVTMIAKALGNVDKGKKLLSSLDKSYAAVRKAHPEFAGKSAVIGSYTSNGFGAYASGDSRVAFMKKLGFTQSKKIDKAAGDQFSVSLSDENLNLLNADLTVILPIYVSAAKAEADALFQKVPSVEKGHAIVVKNKDVQLAFAEGTTSSIEWALKRLPAQFAKKLG